MGLALLTGIAAVAILAVAGAFVVAARRLRDPGERLEQKESGQGTQERRASRSSSQRAVKGFDPEPAWVQIVVSQRVIEVPPEEAGIDRRQFFNRALAGIFFAYLAVISTSILAFLWPKLSGGFGGRVDAGLVSDIKARLLQPDGSVRPITIPEARAYIIPITAEELAGSQFQQEGLAADGLMALWWRCVHLGCRTPWCATSVGFECPCHGSKYNLVGEYQAGPAPRNLDRFAVEISSAGRLVIDTGTVVQTARASRKTVPYPRGPSCIGQVGG